MAASRPNTEEFMALVTKGIKGTQDTLPGESYKIRFLEATIAEIADN